jgi:cell division GTPase FtsZ
MEPTNHKKETLIREQQDLITIEKLNFYDNAMYFFNNNNVMEVLSELEKIKEPTQVIHNAIRELKSVWLKHHWHSIDLTDLKAKITVKN